MEAEKRKQTENDAVPGTRKKAREDNVGQTSVTEDEVEEFFAILRRIHVAVRYFKKGKGDGSKLKEKGSTRRRPTFGLELPEEVNGVKSGVKRDEEDVEENVGFDLNANLDSEGNPI